MEILFGTGITGLGNFGERRSQILERLGEPTKKVLLDDDDAREEWQYYSLESSFRFYDLHDGRLGWIRSDNPNLILLGTKVIGSESSEIHALMKKAGYGEPELDDYEEWSSLTWENVWLELQTTYGRIRSINLGVPWSEEGDEISYAWPKTNS